MAASLLAALLVARLCVVSRTRLRGRKSRLITPKPTISNFSVSARDAFIALRGADKAKHKATKSPVTKSKSIRKTSFVNMSKSVDNAEIILNPDVKYWEQLLESIAKTEGWMYNVEDYMTMAESFEKFWLFLAVDKETGEAIASVSLAYELSVSGEEDEDVYSLGFYYVRPDWRGTGIGPALFERAMEAGRHANMVLHAAMRMSPRYAEKHGFDKMPDFYHVNVVIPMEYLVNVVRTSEYTNRDLHDVDRTLVIAYDAKISRRNRPKYLIKFITTGECYVKVAFNADEEVVGIIAVRAIRLSNYLMIGPFYADNEDVAESLLSSVLSSIIEIQKFSHIESLYPSCNEKAYSLFSAFGGGHAKFRPYTQVAFTKKLLPSGDERVFGILECTSSFI